MQRKHVMVIAEAGVNHNGNFELAKKMIKVASEAGADAVKFQTFIPEEAVSRYAQKADYQIEAVGTAESQLDMVKKLALSFEEFRGLKEYADSLGIEFLSTPFDLRSIRFLAEEMDIRIMKIPSGEITNYPYLRQVALSGKKIILSTGMCTVKDIEEAMIVLKEYGASEIILLHCNTEYPTPYSDVNLRAMETLREKFQAEVGYSDHTMGIEVSIGAAALGAAVIEKHFTLDREMEGPDHKASLLPEELKEMVKCIRNIEESLGTEIKSPSSSEIKNINIARKSIVARRRIEAGELFTEENITAKRPGDGLSPMMWNSVIGQSAKQVFEADEFIRI